MDYAIPMVIGAYLLLVLLGLAYLRWSTKTDKSEDDYP
jgi:nitrogen fixation-related uncharacterized protein